MPEKSPYGIVQYADTFLNGNGEEPQLQQFVLAQLPLQQGFAVQPPVPKACAHSETMPGGGETWKMERCL